MTSVSKNKKLPALSGKHNKDQYEIANFFDELQFQITIMKEQLYMPN